MQTLVVIHGERPQLTGEWDGSSSKQVELVPSGVEVTQIAAAIVPAMIWVVYM